MRKINIYQYYAFGYNYYLLRHQCNDIPIHDNPNSLTVRIDEFLKTLAELSLQVTNKVAVDLYQIRSEIEQLPKDAKVDATLADRVHGVINKLDVTLDAELQLKSAFVVTPKRFTLEHLLSDPGGLFGEDTFEKLPIICQFDFTQAGFCIAFGLPTAAAFHIMRGTEGVLRFYYVSIVKRYRVKLLLWNDMVTQLRTKRGVPKPLLDNLDNIRTNFRNPTQHPEARYDIDEAQDLLSVSIDVVNRMIRHLGIKK